MSVQDLPEPVPVHPGGAVLVHEDLIGPQAGAAGPPGADEQLDGCLLRVYAPGPSPQMLIGEVDACGVHE